jgi:hypothetical protein
MKAVDFSKTPVDHLAFDMEANPIDLHPLQHRENHIMFRRLFISSCQFLSLIRQVLSLVQCKEMVAGAVRETALEMPSEMCHRKPEL